jgi:hypothetical protein
MTKNEALRMALEALKKMESYDSMDAAITAIQEALAQPEQEPVATQLLNRLEHQWHRMGELWEKCQGKGWPSAESDEFAALRDEKTPANRAALLSFFTSPPPKREWVSLTDGKIDAVTNVQWGGTSSQPLAAHRAYARAIEAKLKELNE